MAAPEAVEAMRGGRPGTFAYTIIPASREYLRKYRRDVGALLREARERHGLGLREFARMIDVNPGRVSNIERAVHGWCDSDAAKIANALDNLAGGEPVVHLLRGNLR